MWKKGGIARRWWFSGLVLCTLSVGWLFLGVFQDREFSTLYLFMKHRPSFQWFFFAPLGESDRRLDELPPRLQHEERAFNEFIYEGGGYGRKLVIWL